jgi:hypothetical protein
VKHRQPEKPGGGRDPSSHPTSEERQVKAQIHKLPTSHEEATSYATTNPDNDEVTTCESLDRPRNKMTKRAKMAREDNHHARQAPSMSSEPPTTANMMTNDRDNQMMATTNQQPQHVGDEDEAGGGTEAMKQATRNPCPGRRAASSSLSMCPRAPARRQPRVAPMRDIPPSTAARHAAKPRGR